jgi:hypothetical protein
MRTPGGILGGYTQVEPDIPGGLMGSIDSTASPQLDWIRNAMRAAEAHVRRLRRADAWAIIIGTIASGLAAFVAGITAVQKQPLVAGSWANTCAVAAVLSLAAALATGLHKGLGISDRLTKASACSGKLRALDLAATLGGRAPTDLARECEQVAAEFPDFLI